MDTTINMPATTNTEAKTTQKVDWKQTAITVCCLSFFPLVYLIGRWIMSL